VSPEVSPYLSPVDLRDGLAAMLDRHCGFDAIPRLLGDNAGAPRLLVGAADVRAGRFTVFRSHGVSHRGVHYDADPITATVLVASAAVPTLFRAVDLDGQDFWDGVFAQNPPIRELPDMVRTMPGGEPPDEIWVVRINPQRRDRVPESMAEIRDRRNELAGMISLGQELYFMDVLNRLVAERVVGEHAEGARTKHRMIALRSIAMSDEIAANLDYESKLDRSAAIIEGLQAHGREQAEAFLRDPDGHREPRS
jgi:NTE family protein